jgi:acetyl esterase/lipase
MSKKVSSNRSAPGIVPGMIQFFMGVFGMKGHMEKNIVNNGFSKEPAGIPESISKNYKVQVKELMGRQVWEISQMNSSTATVILYLHGGAYYAGITRRHWLFVKQLLDKTGFGIIVPDYPLAPEFTCEEAYRFLDALYLKLLSDRPWKRIVFMGDSAGGGLALGFAQQLRNENLKQPGEIVLFSPWLDVSMTNPEILDIERKDKILSIEGLKIAGMNYAGNLGVTDYRVSPLFGEFSNLGRITVFTGTHDLLIADARRLRNILESRQIKINYFEYAGMFHDWILLPNLRETEDVLNKVVEQLVQEE